jgi:hypothetical protein
MFFPRRRLEASRHPGRRRTSPLTQQKGQTLMPHATFPVPGGGPAELNFAVTLQPFTDLGPAALPADDALGIVRVTLTRVDQRWNNAFNEVTIRKAEDLFACAARDGACFEPAPKGAVLAEAALEIQFIELPEPHQVTLKPPHSLLVEHPADFARVVEYLSKNGFIRPLQSPGS